VFFTVHALRDCICLCSLHDVFLHSSSIEPVQGGQGVLLALGYVANGYAMLRSRLSVALCCTDVDSLVVIACACMLTYLTYDYCSPQLTITEDDIPAVQFALDELNVRLSTLRQAQTSAIQFGSDRNSDLPDGNGSMARGDSAEWIVGMCRFTVERQLVIFLSVCDAHMVSCVILLFPPPAAVFTPESSTGNGKPIVQPNRVCGLPVARGSVSEAAAAGATGAGIGAAAGSTPIKRIAPELPPRSAPAGGVRSSVSASSLAAAAAAACAQIAEEAEQKRLISRPVPAAPNQITPGGGNAVRAAQFDGMGFDPQLVSRAVIAFPNSFDRAVEWILSQKAPDSVPPIIQSARVPSDSLPLVGPGLGRQSSTDSLRRLAREFDEQDKRERQRKALIEVWACAAVMQMWMLVGACMHARVYVYSVVYRMHDSQNVLRMRV